MKKRLWGFALIFLFFLLTASRILGLFLEPVLEQKLTDLFGMPVTIKGLRVNPLTGGVHASALRFMNQPEFAPAPHLEVLGIDFRIHFLALRYHQVLIDSIDLKQPFYFIDRIRIKGSPENNASTWVHHIKKIIATSDEQDARGKKKEEESKDWHVKIGKIVLHRGTFIFDDRSHKVRNKFVFQSLEGYLAGFEWRTPDPIQLTQEVRVRGLFGENYPEPFWIKGLANFATSDVSFDLHGDIPDGALLEHRRFFSGLPIQIQGGRFSLKSHTVCKQDKLESRNELILKSIQVAPSPSPVAKVWGLPVMASIIFLQNEKMISLNVPVSGEITDAKFEFALAFRQAFQEALGNHTFSGLRFLQEGTARLAGPVSSPAKLVGGGLERISMMVPKKEDNHANLPAKAAT